MNFFKLKTNLTTDQTSIAQAIKQLGLEVIQISDGLFMTGGNYTQSELQEQLHADTLQAVEMDSAKSDVGQEVTPDMLAFVRAQSLPKQE